jgi:hypothetical protein
VRKKTDDRVHKKENIASSELKFKIRGYLEIRIRRM